MNRKIIRMLALMLCLTILCSVAGCRKKKDNKIVDRQEVEYVICDVTMMPNELCKIIEEKRNEKFNISYNTNDYTYIAIGYGMHNTDNYLIQLKDIFKTDESCYVECCLLTKEFVDDMDEASKKDIILSEPSICPVIVIRCPKMDIPVAYYI